MNSPQQLIFDLARHPSYSQEDFVECSCNWEAAQWVRRWPDWPVKMMAIYGEPGCGKTHLAHIWAQRAQARFLAADIVQFSPLEVVAQANAFVLDDADVREDLSETWLFHFYNLIREKGASLLLCSRVPPTQWPVNLPDLRSRLSTFLSVAVNTPDEEALRAVLLKLCADRGMVLALEVADYTLRRVERSFESIRNLVSRLDHKTLTHHRQLTIPLVREVLMVAE